MNKEAMKQMILEALTKRLGADFHISIQKVLKTNVRLDGLTIMKAGELIVPTIYLELFYEELNRGVPINDVADRILAIYFNSKIYPEHFDTAPFLHFELPNERLYVELINRHLNKELLLDVPHTLFLDDFAIVVRCLIGITEDGSSSFLVHNSHLNYCQTDQETLISRAIQNTRKMLGVKLEPMNDYIKDLSPESLNEDIPDNALWIMTNNRQLAGAATVLFDDVLKDFAKEHGNFYVIFSSLQEILLVPTPDCSDIDDITKINQTVNKTQMQQDNILGTKAYYYNKNSGFVL